jgi:MoaA/NifB/PqqE/SkfB family radical SAM enzyme
MSQTFAPQHLIQLGIPGRAPAPRQEQKQPVPMSKTMHDLVKVLHAKEAPKDVIARELGQPYIEYRKRWDAAVAMEYRPPYPIHLDIELAYNCNLECIMCPYGVDDYPHPEYKGKRLDREAVYRIFKEGQQHGLQSVRFTVLNEPLLSKDIFDLIRMARDHGVVDTFITTNATLLTRERSRKLIEAGLNHLYVSVDGATAETYEKIRIGADFKQVIANVHGFLEERERLGKRLPLLRMTFVKMSINQHEVQQFIEQWIDKADHVGIAGYLNNIKNDELSERLQTNAGSMDVFDTFHCYQPWVRGVIYANGDFFPCCTNYGRDTPVGNVVTRSLHDIWNSKHVRFLQDIHKEGANQKHPTSKLCQAKRDNFDGI